MLVNVKCDKCSFRKEHQNPNDWYMIDCPECGKMVIIDDYDMEVCNKLLELNTIAEKLGFKVIEHNEKTEIKSPHLNIKIDTNREKPVIKVEVKNCNNSGE